MRILACLCVSRVHLSPRRSRRRSRRRSLLHSRLQLGISLWSLLLLSAAFTALETLDYGPEPPHRLFLVAKCLFSGIFTLEARHPHKNAAADRVLGLSQRGIAQRGIAQRGIAQRGIAQRGIAQRGIAQRGIAQRGRVVVSHDGTALRPPLCRRCSTCWAAHCGAHAILRLFGWTSARCYRSGSA